MKTLRTLTLLAAAPLALAACQSSTVDDVSYDAIVGNLSPELMGMTERPVDVDRNIQLTSDFNSRMFFDDIGRVLYTDHPSRLSPLPITGTSGNPK